MFQNNIKYLMFSGILLFMSVNIFCQSKADSLEHLLIKSKGIDRAHYLNELAIEYATSNSDTSLQLATEALEIAEKLNNEFEKAFSIYVFGLAYQYKSEYERALEYYNRSLQKRREINDIEGISESLRGIGIIYTKKGMYKEALKVLIESLRLSEETDDKEGISKAYNNIGNIYDLQEKYSEAIIYFEKAGELRKELKDMKGLSISKYNIGNIYMKKGDYSNAAKLYQEALIIFESIDFKPGIISCLNTLGQINEKMVEYVTEKPLEKQEDTKIDTTVYDKSLKYFEKALTIAKDINNKYIIRDIYQNIGTIFSRIQKYEKAELYYFESLKIMRELDDKPGIASTLHNIATTYKYRKNYTSALKYYDEAIALNKEIENDKGLSLNLNALGLVYTELKDYNKALKYLEQSQEIAKKYLLSDYIKLNYGNLASLYDSLGDYKNALNNYKSFIQTKDSLVNADFQRIFTEMQTKYETEKKEQQIQLLNKDKALNENRIHQQKILIIIFIIVSLIILIFLILLFRLFNQKKRANIELAQKNILITAQKQEITDSIHYAKRIQTAILPTAEKIGENIPEYFILFKPKDIVSGDFYWMSKKEEILIITAVDCTGHGVPGAFMSMLGVSFLNEIVNDKGIIHSEEILEHLREYIIRSLQQTGREGEAKDGMDMALCTIYLTSYEMEFSGANNPLYLIRNNELNEIKGDKMPVAIHLKMDKFKRNIIQLENNDTFYVFSDGFVDQFGGAEGKKFKSKTFKNIILNIQPFSMEEQKKRLNKAIEEWKSHINPHTMEPFEQVDDICVIGTRINK
ncbi:MAG: tetratricopeptide repeat protein [Bacteroidia bacterium]|nr:tetratricopeptide repeat protein [Bacteroidia bacterium]